MGILFPLSVTLLVETTIYMFLDRHSIKLFLVASIMNVILNLAMNALLLFVTRTTVLYLWTLIIYEIGTTIVESIIIWKAMRIKYVNTLACSVSANLLSFIIGSFLNEYFTPQKPATFVACIVNFSLYLLLFFGLFFYMLNKHKIGRQSNGYDDGKKETD